MLFMPRLLISLTSLLILLALTVLLPSSAFLNPSTMPTETQLPEERSCEASACYEAAVWIDEQGQLRRGSLPLAQDVIWPEQLEMHPQFTPPSRQRPPNQV